MQRRRHLALGSAEFRLQRVTDQSVPAIPLVGWIDGTQQRTRPLHLSQHDAGAPAAQDGVAQSSRQLGEDGRSYRELRLAV